MDFSALIAELRSIANRYDGKDIDSNVSTVMYCEMFRKILQKAESEVTAYDDQIVILWMTLSQLCQTYKTLVPCPDRNSLYQHIFLLCAKIVLNIKWQQLSDDDHSKQNFRATVEATHKQLVTAGFDRFGLLMNIMENPWTDPAITRIMSGEREEEDDDDSDDDESDKNEGEDGEESEESEEKKEKRKKKLQRKEKVFDEEYRTYIEAEDPLILRLRVEMLMQENCEEWALNLCNCCLRQTKFHKDLDFKVMQFILLFRLNQLDKLQEECETIMCHTGISIIERLEKKESNQALCVRLIQIFLVQDWIKPDRNCCTKNLLQIWIKYQSHEDQDREKFLDSVWAIAKISSKTEQICLLVTGLMKKCGMNLIQLYTDLCVYAINVDKGRCEQQMLLGNMEGVKTQQLAISVTCLKFADLYCNCSPKLARIAALTAFALNPTIANFNVVRKTFTDKRKEKIQQVKAEYSPGKEQKEPKEYKPRQSRYLSKVNPATLYEVERLLNMLRPYYLDPELTLPKLLPVCQKFMEEKGTFQSVKKQPEVKKKGGPPRLNEVQYYCDDSVKVVQKREEKSNPTPVSKSTLQPMNPALGSQFSSSASHSKSEQIQKNSVKPPLFGNKPHSYRAMTATETLSTNRNPKPNLSVQKSSSTQRLVPVAALMSAQETDLQRATSKNSIAELLKATKTLPQSSPDRNTSRSSSNITASSTYTSQNFSYDKKVSVTGSELSNAAHRHNFNMPANLMNRTTLTTDEQLKKQGVHMEYQEVIGNAGDKAIYHHLYQSVPKKPVGKPMKSPLSTCKVSSVESNKSSQRPRIIPVRSPASNEDKHFLPYSNNQRLLSQGGVQNTSFLSEALTGAVNPSTCPSNSSQSRSNLVTLQGVRTTQRRPSAEELKPIVDWLQSGTEDAVKSPMDTTVNQSNVTPVSLGLMRIAPSNTQYSAIQNATQQGQKSPKSLPSSAEMAVYTTSKSQTISQLLAASANLETKDFTAENYTSSGQKQIPLQSKSPKTKKAVLQQTASKISKKLISLQKSSNNSSTITAQLLLNLQQRGMLTANQESSIQPSKKTSSPVVSSHQSQSMETSSPKSTATSLPNSGAQKILTSSDLSLEEMKRRIAQIVHQQKQLALNLQAKQAPQTSPKQRRIKAKPKRESSDSTASFSISPSYDNAKGSSGNNQQVIIAKDGKHGVTSTINSTLTQDQLQHLQQHLSASQQQQISTASGLGLVQQNQISTVVQQQLYQTAVQQVTQPSTLGSMQILQQPQIQTTTIVPQQVQQSNSIHQASGQPSLAGGSVSFILQQEQQQEQLQHTPAIVTKAAQCHSLPSISVLVQQPMMNCASTEKSISSTVVDHSNLLTNPQTGEFVAPVHNLQNSVVLTSDGAQTISLQTTNIVSQDVQQHQIISPYNASTVSQNQSGLLYQSAIPNSQSGVVLQNATPQGQSGIISQSALPQNQSGILSQTATTRNQTGAISQSTFPQSQSRVMSQTSSSQSGILPQNREGIPVNIDQQTSYQLMYVGKIKTMELPAGFSENPLHSKIARKSGNSSKNSKPNIDNRIKGKVTVIDKSVVNELTKIIAPMKQPVTSTVPKIQPDAESARPETSDFCTRMSCEEKLNQDICSTEPGQSSSSNYAVNMDLLAKVVEQEIEQFVTMEAPQSASPHVMEKDVVQSRDNQGTDVCNKQETINVLKPETDNVLKPETDHVLKPETDNVLKPETDNVLKPATNVVESEANNVLTRSNEDDLTMIRLSVEQSIETGNRSFPSEVVSPMTDRKTESSANVNSNSSETGEVSSDRTNVGLVGSLSDVPCNSGQLQLKTNIALPYMLNTSSSVVGSTSSSHHAFATWRDENQIQATHINGDATNVLTSFEHQELRSPSKAKDENILSGGSTGIGDDILINDSESNLMSQDDTDHVIQKMGQGEEGERDSQQVDQKVTNTVNNSCVEVNEHTSALDGTNNVGREGHLNHAQMESSIQKEEEDGDIILPEDDSGREKNMDQKDSDNDSDVRNDTNNSSGENQEITRNDSSSVNMEMDSSQVSEFIVEGQLTRKANEDMDSSTFTKDGNENRNICEDSFRMGGENVCAPSAEQMANNTEKITAVKEARDVLTTCNDITDVKFTLEQTLQENKNDSECTTDLPTENEESGHNTSIDHGSTCTEDVEGNTASQIQITDKYDSDLDVDTEMPESTAVKEIFTMNTTLKDNMGEMSELRNNDMPCPANTKSNVNIDYQNHEEGTSLSQSSTITQHDGNHETADKKDKDQTSTVDAGNFQNTIDKDCTTILSSLDVAECQPAITKDKDDTIYDNSLMTSDPERKVSNDRNVDSIENDDSGFPKNETKVSHEDSNESPNDKIIITETVQVTDNPSDKESSPKLCALKKPDAEETKDEQKKRVLRGSSLLQKTKKPLRVNIEAQRKKADRIIQKITQSALTTYLEEDGNDDSTLVPVKSKDRNSRHSKFVFTPSSTPPVKLRITKEDRELEYPRPSISPASSFGSSKSSSDYDAESVFDFPSKYDNPEDVSLPFNDSSGQNKCLICSKSFKSVLSLKHHIRNACRSTNKPDFKDLRDYEYSSHYACVKCGMSSVLESQVQNHVKECQSQSALASGILTCFKCEMCGLVFNSKSVIHKHVSKECHKLQSFKEMKKEKSKELEVRMFNQSDSLTMTPHSRSTSPKGAASIVNRESPKNNSEFKAGDSTSSEKKLKDDHNESKVSQKEEKKKEKSKTETGPNSLVLDTRLRKRWFLRKQGKVSSGSSFKAFEIYSKQLSRKLKAKKMESKSQKKKIILGKEDDNREEDINHGSKRTTRASADKTVPDITVDKSGEKEKPNLEIQDKDDKSKGQLDKKALETEKGIVTVEVRKEDIDTQSEEIGQKEANIRDTNRLDKEPESEIEKDGTLCAGTTDSNTEIDDSGKATDKVKPGALETNNKSATKKSRKTKGRGRPQTRSSSIQNTPDRSKEMVDISKGSPAKQQMDTTELIIQTRSRHSSTGSDISSIEKHPLVKTMGETCESGANERQTRSKHPIIKVDQSSAEVKSDTALRSKRLRVNSGSTERSWKSDDSELDISKSVRRSRRDRFERKFEADEFDSNRSGSSETRKCQMKSKTGKDQTMKKKDNMADGKQDTQQEGDPSMLGKRLIKVKKYDQFEVPEFLKTQIKNSNIKRQIKTQRVSGKVLKGKCLPNKNISQEMITPSSQSQKCPKCGSRFGSSSKLVKHIASIHLSPYKSKYNHETKKCNFVCQYCKMSFRMYVQFLKHVPIHAEKILLDLSCGKAVGITSKVSKLSRQAQIVNTMKGQDDLNVCVKVEGDSSSEEVKVNIDNVGEEDQKLQIDDIKRSRESSVCSTDTDSSLRRSKRSRKQMDWKDFDIGKIARKQSLSPTSETRNPTCTVTKDLCESTEVHSSSYNKDQVKENDKTESSVTSIDTKCTEMSSGSESLILTPDKVISKSTSALVMSSNEITVLDDSTRNELESLNSEQKVNVKMETQQTDKCPSSNLRSETTPKRKAARELRSQGKKVPKYSEKSLDTSGGRSLRSAKKAKYSAKEKISNKRSRARSARSVNKSNHIRCVTRNIAEERSTRIRKEKTGQRHSSQSRSARYANRVRNSCGEQRSSCDNENSKVLGSSKPDKMNSKSKNSGVVCRSEERRLEPLSDDENSCIKSKKNYDGQVTSHSTMTEKAVANKTRLHVSLERLSVEYTNNLTGHTSSKRKSETELFRTTDKKSKTLIEENEKDAISDFDVAESDKEVFFKRRVKSKKKPDDDFVSWDGEDDTDSDENTEPLDDKESDYMPEEQDEDDVDTDGSGELSDLEEDHLVSGDDSVQYSDDKGFKNTVVDDEEFSYVKSPAGSKSFEEVFKASVLRKSKMNTASHTCTNEKNAFLNSFMSYIDKRKTKISSDTKTLPSAQKLSKSKQFRRKRKISRKRKKLKDNSTVQQEEKDESQSCHSHQNHEQTHENQNLADDNVKGAQNKGSLSFLDSFLAHCSKKKISSTSNTSEKNLSNTAIEEKTSNDGQQEDPRQVMASESSVTSPSCNVSSETDLKAEQSDCVNHGKTSNGSEHREASTDNIPGQSNDMLTDNLKSDQDKEDSIIDNTVTKSDKEAVKHQEDEEARVTSEHKDTIEDNSKVARSKSNPFLETFKTFLSSSKSSEKNENPKDTGKQANPASADTEETKPSADYDPFTWNKESSSKSTTSNVTEDDIARDLKIAVDRGRRAGSVTSEDSLVTISSRGTDVSDYSETGNRRSRVSAMLNSKPEVRHIYHNGKIWHVGKGAVTSVPVKMETDSPLAVTQKDCSENKTDKWNSVVPTVQVIKVDRKVESDGLTKSFDKSDSNEECNTYTSTTLEDLRKPKTDAPAQKWRIQRQGRGGSSSVSSGRKKFTYSFQRSRKT